MKVLIADKFEQSGIDGLEAAGCEVLYQPDLKDAALAEAIRDSHAEVLVVRGTEVSAAALEAGQLALVVRAGAGYNTIDVAAASRRGIYVSNCPGRNAIAVAELTFALILALDRRVPDNVADLRAGRWNKKEYSKARGLFGRTLGLIGYGSIGAEVAQRAHAFGMPVVVWSRRFTGGHIDVAMPFRVVESPQRLAEISDVVSVHLALTKETRGFVDASILGQMRPGSYFINTARAEVVDYDALTNAARERRHPRRSGRVRRRAGFGHGGLQRPVARAAECLRHPSHRGLDRSGPGSDRGRNRPGRDGLQDHRPRTECRQPRGQDTCDSPADRSPPRSTRGARPCVRSC